jgi:hypothetical protein
MRVPWLLTLFILIGWLRALSEASEAKRDGAKLTKNSGRGQYQKGDAYLGIFTVDYKEYPKGFTVSENVWAKICSDAMRNGQSEPALKIILGAGNSKTRLWVVAEHIIADYLRLLDFEQMVLDNAGDKRT